MLLRLVAVLGGLAPAVLPFVAPSLPTLALLAPGLLGLVIVVATRRRGPAVVGVLLALAAGMLAPAARDLLPLTGVGGEAATHVDLHTEGFPNPAPKYAEVRGRYRGDWLLDEYAVAADGRPNQSTAAAAVLVAFVGTTEDVVELRGAIVVARVAAGTPMDTNAVTIRGRVQPLPDELLMALVSIAGSTDDSGTKPVGFIIDTLDNPQPGEAWTRLILVLLLALGALVCLWIAATPLRPEGD